MANKIYEAAIGAGLGDDSYGEAFKAKKTEIENKRQQDAALKQLLQGKQFDEEAGVREHDRSLGTAETLRKKYGPNTPINVSGSGGVSIGGSDQLANFFRQFQMQQAVNDKLDKKVETYGTRLEKSNVPQAESMIENLERSTAAPGKGGMVTDPNYQMKSGGMSRAIGKLPLIGRGLLDAGEAMGLRPKGAGAEDQALQALQNVEIKNLSGGNVTGGEDARNMISQGTSPFGDPRAALRGVGRMKQTLEQERRNIDSSTAPEAVKTYQAQGGSPGLKLPSAGAPKKQYSPSRNQTRIIHPDGRVEILDGQH